MGWFGGHWLNRKGVIEELTTGRDEETAEGGTKRRTIVRVLRHCYRGNAFSGVLWSVWESTVQLDGVQLHHGRWINCDLLQYWTETSNGQVPGWHYRPLGDERQWPYYYSCPLGYLDLVPESVYPELVNQEWRILVRLRHEERRKKRNA